MGIDDRLVFLLLGCAIGFVLGRLDRRLRAMKEQMDEIDECVHECRKRIRNERGAMRMPSRNNIALFLVVAMTLYAAVMSQLASNTSNDTSDRVITLQAEQKQNLDCTTQVLFDAIRALNERTTYSGAQADANIALVQGQLNLLLKIQDPNLTTEERQALFQIYVEQVQEFIELATKTKGQQLQFPYPTVDDLTTCLAQTSDDTEEPKGG